MKIGKIIFRDLQNIFARLQIRKPLFAVHGLWTVDRRSVSGHETDVMFCLTFYIHRNVVVLYAEFRDLCFCAGKCKLSESFLLKIIDCIGSPGGMNKGIFDF